VLCAVTVLCYCSYQIPTVILPLFVQGLGGSPVVAGLVFTSFSVTSFLLRPLMGHLTDSWSPRGTLFGGGAILGVLALACAIPSIWVTLVANAIRGIGWGACTTSLSTSVALTSAPARRGEASGYYTVATTLASAFAPALAFWLLDATGQFVTVFGLAGAAGLIAAAATGLLPRVASRGTSLRRALALPRSRVNLGTFVDRPVLLASLLLTCITLTAPVSFAFVPLHAKGIGIENISWYFVASGATSVLARLLLGRTADRASRGTWIAAGYVVLIGAFFVFTLAQRLEVFIAAAILNAIGQSLVQPSLLAFAMDRAESGRMGKAMATYSMFYRVGEGTGAPIAGALIVAFGYAGMYVGAMFFAALGLVLTLVNWRTVGKPIARVLAG
jgi:MFS family permease